MMVEMVWGWHKVDLGSIKEGSAVEVLIVLNKRITTELWDHSGSDFSRQSHTYYGLNLNNFHTPNYSNVD
jgi:hypothetical protein